jgi:RHS repeat-associated protein
MRRCRINLSNRYHHLISRVAHRAYFLDGDERTRLVDFVRRVVSQRGATYPVDYSYDEFGEKVSMTTYRNVNGGTGNEEQGTGNGAVQGDVTRWLRDEATGLVTNKVYADGKGPRYDYTPDGKLATRTWARGIVTTYSYDDNGALTNTVYSDGTPTISLAYNRAGRHVRAEDAAGVTTFLYDDFGSLTNETVIGVAGTNTIERFYDTFGRNAGYALNGIRQSALAYDPATGRLASMLANGSDTPFTWNYLAGSDLKSSLAYPNGLTASWTYDANGQLLQVKNAFSTNTISQYDYVYDAARRRINVSKSGTAFNHDDTIAYGYNEKSELTNAVAAVDAAYRYSYDFDEIGNRESSSERGTNSVYTANNLNQYTAVDGFTPQFDDDGNQTLVKTATGIWSVTYNGENRPVQWSNGSTNIVMSFDRMGRRVVKNAQRFVYDGYLQIANFELVSTNSQITTHNAQLFVWDPTEPIATRPLVWKCGAPPAYYVHDGNKNVCEVVAGNGEVSAYNEYAPFGVVTVQRGKFVANNPWCFSCEYAEDDTATVYYNYRHFSSECGRWLTRDPVSEIAAQSQPNLRNFLMHLESAVKDQRDSSYCSFLHNYTYVDNKLQYTDALGLVGRYDPPPPYTEIPFPPCCPSQRSTCNAICMRYLNFSKALCDLNYVIKYRCRCVCKWYLKHSTSSGFPGYTRDVDCTYSNSTGKEHTIGYYAQPMWFKCLAYIELGCP